MTTVSIPAELWSEFDEQVDALIKGAKAAEDSYTAGRGMSLASIAVGSAVMQLSKVRAMAQSRDLLGTKQALEKATIKVREAAFTSSGDPEGVTLGENLGILATLVDILGQMENPRSKRREQPNVGELATNRAAAADKADHAGGRPETGREGAPDNRKGGLFHDLGIVEPDDNPLSYLIDEGDSTGGGRPKMRFLVAPVEPKLLEKEKKLYWSNDLRGHTDRSFDILSPTSLIGEGRRHNQVLQEALLNSQTSVDAGNTLEDQHTQSPVPVDSATTIRSTTSTGFSGALGDQKRERNEAGTRRDEKAGKAMVNLIETDVPRSLTGNRGYEAAPRHDFETTQSLREQVRQARKDDYWPRRSLAYSLEEEGEYFAAAGNFSASCSAYSEASNVFWECSKILPADPDPLLRHWVTAQRAREVGNTQDPPKNEILQRCIKICKGSSTDHRSGTSGCKNVVCYEAHLELAGTLLLCGEFERCTQICGHILEQHDPEDAEAMFSLAQALEALGRCEEARKCGERASSLALASET